MTAPIVPFPEPPPRLAPGAPQPEPVPLPDAARDELPVWYGAMLAGETLVAAGCTTWAIVLAAGVLWP